MEENEFEDRTQKVNPFIKLRNLIGPTFIAISLTIGGGSLTTVTSLASQTGFKFIWSLIPQIFVLFMFITAANRITLVTGEGVISGVKTYINKYISWIFAGVVILGTVVFHAPQYLLASSAFSSLLGGGATIWALVIYVIVLFIVLNPLKRKNHMKLIELFLRICIFGLILAFIMVVFFIDIEWRGVANGIVPVLPSSQNEWLMFSSIMGAALTINVPVLSAYIVKQKKWNASHIKMNKKENLFSNLLFLSVQLLIIIAIGSTLFIEGVIPETGLEGALALAPFAGSWGSNLFILGLVGAVLSTIITQLLVCGYVITDLFGWNQDINSNKFKAIQIVIATIGASAPLLGWEAVPVMTIAGVINVFFIPIGLSIWWFIGNKKNIMGQFKFSFLENIGISICVLLSIMTGILSFL